MPKLIFNHTKPDVNMPWVLPVAPYHLNCSDPEDATWLVTGISIIESETDPGYPGYVSKEAQIISDTQIKVIYNFDTVTNRNAARALLQFHIKCQSVTTKTIPVEDCKPHENVVMSIVD